MSEHTKEPWLVIDADHAYQYHGTYIEDENGDTVCDLYVLDDISIKPIEQKNSLQNARRIVAAVNACAGIETEIIERNVGNVWHLLQQRDQLLDCLRDVEKWIEELPVPTRSASFYYEKIGNLIAEIEAAK